MPSSHPAEATAVLLARARGGDDAARERLVERFLPLLRRWAHGRLPVRARGAVDTDDLVQVTLLSALRHLDDFEHRHEGAFLAYLRRILLNRVRDAIRRSRPAWQPLSDDFPDTMSLVEQLIGREVVERYEEALQALDERQREAVILRLEFDYSHDEVAAAVGCPSGEAARKLVSRSLARLAELLAGRV